MPVMDYNREAAVDYARTWALGRNPKYYDYSGLGGDCSNFASQCILSGSGVMNYQKPLGWYYIGANNHSASWTGVAYLYNYLTRRTGVGPVGREADISQIQIGDIVQFAGQTPQFSHTLLITAAGTEPALDNILVCAHTNDVLDRPLSTYIFHTIRFIHIVGVRK